MTKYYEEIINARLVIEAEDATYAVQFDEEWNKGKTWEFDPMSDAVGQWEYKRTGKIRVRLNPVKDTMTFPEDANRRLEYVMPIEDARNFWKFMHKEVHFWFALDMAFQGELKGFDPELIQMMVNCNGCVANVETV